MRHLLDPTDLSTAEIDAIIERALDIIAHKEKYADACRGKKLATLFYEPSTRTRLSFTAAMMELGGNVLGFSDARSSSVSKGETVADTIRVVSAFADIVAMRHYKEGAPRVASEYSRIPIINAGDGGHSHPTQTMTDLLTIRRELGHFDHLTVGLCGDLKYGRTVHSLIMAMRHFNPTFHFVAPQELSMPSEYKLYCKKHGIKYVEHTEFNEDVISEADILYMTRVQKERFSDLMEYEKVKNVYILKSDMLNNARENMKILHPLPRVNEISYDVDENPHAYYIQQAQNGLYAREAIICDVLGIGYDQVAGDTTIIK